MKAYGGVDVYIHVVSFTALKFHPPYSLDRRLGGSQSRSGRYEEVKILDPTGIRTPINRLSRQ
jgi:hypothetical protein